MTIRISWRPFLFGVCIGALLAKLLLTHQSLSFLSFYSNKGMYSLILLNFTEVNKNS